MGQFGCLMSILVSPFQETMLFVHKTCSLALVPEVKWIAQHLGWLLGVAQNP